MTDWIPSVTTLVKAAGGTAATLATVGGGLIYYGQSYIIYPSAFLEIGPGSLDCDTPDEYNLAWEDLELKTPDGVTLKCYLLPQRRTFPQPSKYADMIRVRDLRDRSKTDEEIMAKRPTVIMFHGNAGTVGHRIPLGMVFQLQMRCNVVMVEYRGYGKCTGSPTEKGLRIDAQTALDYVLSDSRLAKTPIILYGQSIGGAVATSLAVNPANHPRIHSMILENTFTSLPALVPHVLPMLANFSWLCHQKWNTAEAVSEGRLSPELNVLLLSGSKDEIVPSTHMKKLKELFEQSKSSAGEGKKVGKVIWKDFANGTHNTTTGERGYWDAVAAFVASCVERRP